MSVSQIERKGKKFIIKDDKVKIRNTMTKQVMYEAYKKNELYIVRVEVDLMTKVSAEINFVQDSQG